MDKKRILALALLLLFISLITLLIAYDGAVWLQSLDKYNQSWLLLDQSDVESDNAETVSLMRDVLISNPTPEKKFTEAMGIIEAYYSYDRFDEKDYYQLYWFVISDEKTDDLRTNEAIEALRLLMFVDKDFNSKLADLSILIDYNPRGITSTSVFGDGFKYYLNYRYTFQKIMTGEVKIESLLKPIPEIPDWLWYTPFVFFLSGMFLVLLSVVKKK
jgi:hypothetical protein